MPVCLSHTLIYTDDNAPDVSGLSVRGLRLLPQIRGKLDKYMLYL